MDHELTPTQALLGALAIAVVLSALHLAAPRIRRQPAGTAGRLLCSRIAYLAGLATVLTIALAELIYLFEHRPGGTLPAFTDALVGAGSVVIGMQADPVPTSRLGQFVMLGGFRVGLILVATLAGGLGAFLLEGRDERQPSHPGTYEDSAVHDHVEPTSAPVTPESSAP